METNETLWKIVIGTLAALVTGLLAIIKALITKVHQKATPEDVRMARKLQRDMEALQKTVDGLVRREEIREEIDHQSRH